MDRYTVPSHLDDPELIGFWTLDEFLAMSIPFIWGILSQHVVIGLATSMLGWWSFRKLKAGRHPPGCSTSPTGTSRRGSPVSRRRRLPISD